MIANPKQNDLVELRYNPKARQMPGSLHAKAGQVIIAGRGKPRNHGIVLNDGRFVVVPCGNLRKAN